MQRISEEELFPIKSAAAKRAGETKKACRQIEQAIALGVNWYTTGFCPELNEALGIPASPAGRLQPHPLNEALGIASPTEVRLDARADGAKRFKALLIKKAQALCSEVVIRRRQGGLVFETKVTLESVQAAFRQIVDSVPERFHRWASQQQQANGGEA